MEQTKTRKALEFLVTLVISVTLAAFIRTFLIQVFIVDGSSMRPSLTSGDRVVVDKISYRLHPPERGDVVVVRRPGGESSTPLIKRVIGVPGDTIAIQRGTVLRNGEPLAEPYVIFPLDQNLPELKVQPGEIYVLGDNRANSADSRFFGQVSIANVDGRADIRFWPIVNVGTLAQTAH